MSNYTTGEIAKLCGVSVRTVQYYDDRGILTPTALSEGGRRLYSQSDLHKLRVICVLREVGLSIRSISALFAEKDQGKIVSILLEEQAHALREEACECQRKLDLIGEIRRELRDAENFSVESIADVAHVMKQKNKLNGMRRMMLLTGIPVTALQWTSIVLWITHGLWWLFVIWALVAIPWGIFVSLYYFRRVAYICPECHETFRPRFGELFWAYHTPRMRRLTCPNCGRKGMCVEVYADRKKE